MTEHQLRMASIELLRISKLLLYWGDVECCGAQLKDLNEAKETIDKYHERLRQELPHFLQSQDYKKERLRHFRGRLKTPDNYDSP